MDFDPEYDIDITGLSHAAVLAALYNAASPLGLGFIHATPEAMTEEEAAAILKKSAGFLDYVKGRPLKITFDGNILRRYDLYDRDQGKGKAASIIAALKREMKGAD